MIENTCVHFYANIKMGTKIYILTDVNYILKYKENQTKK